MKVTQSCPTLCYPLDCSPWNSPGQNTGVGSLSLLQGIFPTQGPNPGLPHCRQILYQLSHKGSPKYVMVLPNSQTQKNRHHIIPCGYSLTEIIHKKQKYMLFKVKKVVIFWEKEALTIWRWHIREHFGW